MNDQPNSLRDEVLSILAGSDVPLSSGEIYGRSTLAVEAKQIANALYQLKAAGRIRRAAGDGQARYELAQPEPAASTGDPERPAQPPGIRVPQAVAGMITGKAAAATAAAPAPGADPASLADAIITRLKRDLGPLLRTPVVGDVDVTTAPGAIHISVQSVEITISVGGSA